MRCPRQSRCRALPSCCLSQQMRTTRLACSWSLALIAERALHSRHDPRAVDLPISVARSADLYGAGADGRDVSAPLRARCVEAVIGGGANQPDVPSPAPRARALTLRFA